GRAVRRVSLYTRSVFRRFGAGFESIRGQQLDWKLPPAGFFNRIIIPGLSHLHVGQRLKGWIFLTSFLFFLVASLLYMGTGSGSVLLGIAFSIHSSAALDVLMQLAPPIGMRSRIMASFVISALLFALLYLPVIFLMSRVAIPR